MSTPKFQKIYFGAKSTKITVFDLITTLCVRCFKITGKTSSTVKFHLMSHFKEVDLMRRVFYAAYAILSSDFLYKSICCGYSFELPQLVEANQMSTNNICFYKEVDKSTLAVI